MWCSSLESLIWNEGPWFIPNWSTRDSCSLLLCALTSCQIVKTRVRQRVAELTYEKKTQGGLHNSPAWKTIQVAFLRFSLGHFEM